MQSESERPVEPEPLPEDRTLPEELLTEVYDELRAVARRALESWRSPQSLDATALVSEAWLRLRGSEVAAALDPLQFTAYAARAIRNILVDRFRRKRAERRGGELERVPISDSIALTDAPSIDFLALDECLGEMAEIWPRRARIVELRFFGGLGEVQVAQALQVSQRTVASDWRFAKAWLRERLTRGTPS